MKQRFSPVIGTSNLIGTPAGDQQPTLENTGDCAGGSGETPGRRMKRTPAPALAGIMTSRTVFAIALFAAALGFGLPGARLYAESANTDFKQGQAAEAREDYDTAFDDYQKAFNKDQRDTRFRIALARVRVTASSVHVTRGRKLAQAGDNQGALGEFLHAAEIDPSNEAAQQEIARIRLKQGESAPVAEVGLPQPPAEAEQLQTIESPPELKPVSNEPLSLHMAEDSKVVYETVGKAAGINVMFDPDYHGTRIDVDLNNVSLLDALRIVGVMSNTFWRPVTSNTIFVAQNTPSKRRDLDEQAVQTFYLTNAWQQNDLNDVATAIRNVMPTAKAFPVQSQNAIVMRGTPDELLLAQQLIENLDKPRGEVVVDIAVLEVSKNWEKTLGMQWPSSFGVTLQPNCAATNSCSSSTTSTGTTGTTGSATSTVSPTLYSLAHLNSTDFAVTVGSATLNLLLTDNNTKVLQSPRIRATDAQKATMKIGSRIPIATGSYQTGAATALVSSLVNTQFQYQDVGVNIEMTPSVHYDHDVTLKIKIEVSAESGTETISGVTEPIISQRVVDQVIRLREGEASILGGIQNKQEAQNWTGVPGLSAIPILKYIFGSKDHTIQDDDIVFVVVPHIVRSQELDQANLRVIDTGLGQAAIALRYGDNDNGPGTPAVVPTAHTMPAQRPEVGSIPAQSAIEAAPQMLAQLRSDMGSTRGPTTTAQAAVPQPNLPVTPSPPSPPLGAPSPQAPATPPPAAAPPPPAASASLALNVPATPMAAGATFQVPVVLNGGTDVTSIALQLHYDTAKLQLSGVAAGDILSRDGQPTGLSHVEDPPGTLVVSISRPPGTHGITGTGVVCVLTFQAKASGESGLGITRASVVNAAQQQVSVQTGQATIVVK
jgi:general secretion pathway protein D